MDESRKKEIHLRKQQLEDEQKKQQAELETLEDWLLLEELEYENLLLASELRMRQKIIFYFLQDKKIHYHPPCNDAEIEDDEENGAKLIR